MKTQARKSRELEEAKHRAIEILKELRKALSNETSSKHKRSTHSDPS